MLNNFLNQHKDKSKKKNSWENEEKLICFHTKYNTRFPQKCMNIRKGLARHNMYLVCRPKGP